MPLLTYILQICMRLLLRPVNSERESGENERESGENESWKEGHAVAAPLLPLPVCCSLLCPNTVDLYEICGLSTIVQQLVTAD
jgi:hypothetical protein